MGSITRAQLCFWVLTLGLLACTPGGGSDSDSTPAAGSATSKPEVETILCQLSAGIPGDSTPLRKDLALDVSKAEVSKSAEVGPFKVYVNFNNDGLGAPHLSLGIGDREAAGFNLLATETFQFRALEGGRIEAPENQIGSGFTGTAYIEHPTSRVRLSRFCRVLA